MRTCPNCGRRARAPYVFCSLCRPGLAQHVKANHPRITLDAIEERHGIAARDEIAAELQRKERR